MKNPFAVISPEELTAETANQLFVEMHSDLPQIKRPGNVIISGARGCGKSMLIRCSLPDVLMIKDGNSFSKLEYLALRVHVKRTSLNITDLQLLDNIHAPYLINEHCMTLYVLMHSLLNLTDIRFEPYDSETEGAYRKFFENTYERYMRLSGCKDEIDVDYSSPNEFFRSLYRHAEDLQFSTIDYIARLQLNTSGTDYSYNLPLLSFLRFIYPVFKELMNLPGFPQGKHLYIFIDDADNLSKTQTEILNSWLACRTQPAISLKVSTQIDMYKTYLTTTGVLVESPHDYQEVNISYRYTTNVREGKYNYYEKAYKIIEKRLTLVGIKESPDAFFPAYGKQEEGIKVEAEKIKNDFPLTGRGYAVSDDIRRYAIPNYIKNLGGTSKSRSTYRYAGLDNIIHLSSGIIRYLLDATMKMYDVALSKSGDPKPVVKFIDTDIQDSVMREQADHFLYTELKKSEQEDPDFERAPTPIDFPQNNMEKLQNLISAMGRTFHEILISDRSERKVFSVALSNVPDSELKNVFRLGVRLGFLHEMRIGNKEANGRTMLYILNRCFAPLFTLDPTGFQGYLFMTNNDLHKAIKDGKQLRRISRKDLGDGSDPMQLSFDDIWED